MYYAVKSRAGKKKVSGPVSCIWAVFLRFLINVRFLKFTDPERYRVCKKLNLIETIMLNNPDSVREWHFCSNQSQPAV